MAKNIKEKAQETLLSAYAIAQKNDTLHSSKYANLIDFVINGTHLTYKYVLFNALLAKASDNSLNPLCLQKGSTLPGAFDARTICHKVIVPFEQTELQKVLGGSNEPFLNKPARFPELSKTNAVRRGKDQEMLYRLCNELPTIRSSAEAFSALVYLLQKLIELRDQKASLTIFSIPQSVNLPNNLVSFCFRALNENFEGEILTLIIAGLYHLLYLPYSGNVKVEVHPVNESGASSKEISDLDIYLDDVLISSNELKDKPYSDSDVRHAADKVLVSGGSKMLFIEGPRGHAEGDFENRLVAEYAAKNFMLGIVPSRLFIPSIVAMIPNIDCHEFIRFILDTAHETKFKEEVITYIDDIARSVLELKR